MGDRINNMDFKEGVIKAVSQYYSEHKPAFFIRTEKDNIYSGYVSCNGERMKICIIIDSNTSSVSMVATIDLSCIGDLDRDLLAACYETLIGSEHVHLSFTGKNRLNLSTRINVQRNVSLQDIISMENICLHTYDALAEIIKILIDDENRESSGQTSENFCGKSDEVSTNVQCPDWYVRFFEEESSEIGEEN